MQNWGNLTWSDKMCRTGFGSAICVCETQHREGLLQQGRFNSASAVLAPTRVAVTKPWGSLFVEKSCATQSCYSLSWFLCRPIQGEQDNALRISYMATLRETFHALKGRCGEPSPRLLQNFKCYRCQQTFKISKKPFLSSYHYILVQLMAFFVPALNMFVCYLLPLFISV